MFAVYGADVLVEDVVAVGCFSTRLLYQISQLFEMHSHKITCQHHCLTRHFSKLSVSPKEDLLCEKSA